MSTPDNSNDMLLQISIDQAHMASSAAEAMAVVQKTLGKGVDLPINVETNVGQSVQQLAKVTQEIDEISASLDKATKEMSELQTVAKQKAEALEKVMKGAAETISKSFEKGAGEAEKALNGILEQAKKLETGTKKNFFEEAFGDSGKAVERATKDIKRLSEMMLQLKKQQQAAPSQVARSVIGEELEEVRRKRMAAIQRFTQGSNPAVGREALRIGFGGTPNSSSNASADAQVRAFYEAEAARRRAVEETQRLRERVMTERAARTASGGGAGGGGGGRPLGAPAGGGGEPFRFNIDVPHLILQIEKAFIPTYKLNLDVAHIEAQLANLKLGGMVAAASASAGPTEKESVVGATRTKQYWATRRKVSDELSHRYYDYISANVPGAAEHLDILQGLTGPGVNRAGMTMGQLQQHRTLGANTLQKLRQSVDTAGLDPAAVDEIRQYLNQQYGTPFKQVGAAINKRGINTNERLLRLHAEYSDRESPFNQQYAAFVAASPEERAMLRDPLNKSLGRFSRTVNTMLSRGVGDPALSERLKTQQKDLYDIDALVNAGRKLSEYEKDVAAEHNARMKQQAAEDKAIYKDVAAALKAQKDDITKYEKEAANEHLARMKQRVAEDKTYEKEIAEAEIARMRYLAREEKKYQTESANYWMARQYGKKEANGSGYGATVRNMLALVGGVGIGYSAYNMIGNSMRTQMEYGQQIAGLQGMIGSRDPRDVGTLSSGIGHVAAKYGMDLVEAAKAAQMFVRADRDAAEVVKDLDHAMAASKALGLTMQQVEELQIAVKEVTADNDKYNQSIDYTSIVLDKISAVQSHYALGANDMAQAIKILTPLIDNFTNGLGGMNDTFDYTIALTRVVAEKLRITGVQAANSLKLVFSRITTPQTLKKLQSQYGVKVGNSETGDYLPVDRLIGELGHTYATLAPDKQKQFVEQLGGSRNINAVTALLEDYAKVQDTAAKSSASFGDSQSRAAISMDTMLTRVNQLKIGFTLFTKEALESTHVADGLKATISGLAAVFNAIGSATGTGGLLGTVGLVLGGGGLYKGGKALYTMLKETAGAAADAEGVVSGLFGELATIFTPGGVILAGALTLVGVIGLLVDHFQKADEEAGRYKVTLRDITSLQGAPQLQILKDTAAARGLGSASSAFTTVSGILSPGNAGPFSSLAGDLKKFSEMNEKEFDKFYTKNPEALRHFQREFTKIFIEQLPKDARDSFGQMKTEGEKIGDVMKLVGGAAFTATAQMKAAIEDLGAATQRMMDDTLKKLAQLEQAKRDPNFLQRLAQLFMPSADLYSHIGIIGGANDEYRRGQVISNLQGMTQEGTPAYKALLDDTTLTKFAATKILTPQRLAQINAGKGGSYVTLANDLLEAVQGDQGMNMRYNLALVRRTGDWASLASVSDVDLKKIGATDQDLEQVRFARLGANAQAGAANLGKSLIEGANPARTRLGNIDRALNRAGSGGTATALSVPVNGANEALVHFKDVLLDTARQIYEAVRKFNFERDFARTYKQAYDVGGSQVQLGRTLLNIGDDFADSHRLDIVGIARQAQYLKVNTTVDPATGKRVPKAGLKKEEYAEQIDTLTQELKDFDNGDLEALFGTTPEGKEFIASLRASLQRVGAGDLEPFGKMLPKIGDFLVQRGLTNQYLRQDALQQGGLGTLLAGNEGQLGLAAVGNDDPLNKRLTAQSDAAQKNYLAQKANLDIQLQQKTISEKDYKLATDKLDAEYQINQLFQDRLALTQEQQKYDDQAKANIGTMLSGFKRTLTDSSIWENVVFPKGADPHQRWKESAIALRNILFDTITPVFKTINDRVVENIFQKLVYNLSETGPLKDIVNSGEYVLKSNIDGAQIHYNAMLSAFNQGASIHYRAIVAAMTGGAMPSVAGVGLINGLGLGDSGSGAGGISDATAVGLPSTGRMSGAQMALLGGGVMAGQIGGTLLGKGGQHAQQGAAIGTNVGLLAGTAVGGPIGGAVGAVLGGIVGGLFGGRKDDHNRALDDPVVKGLDAIERAQRDTITTINSQTDALLKPENRFLNLPANIRVPDYSPVGAGGRLSVDVNLNLTGNASAEVAKPVGDAVGQAVKDALGNFLYDQRRNRSRT